MRNHYKEVYTKKHRIPQNPMIFVITDKTS